MSNPYIGEIRMFGGTFAPLGWEFCNGQLLQISENDTLFTLIGTTYGGDGESTFALPDLQGRLPIHQGPGPGLTSRQLGETGGAEEVTLTLQQIPSHTHPLSGSRASGSQPNLAGAQLASSGQLRPYVAADPDVNLAAQSVAGTGGSQPHTNMQPYLCVSFIISLFGVFPQPN